MEEEPGDAISGTYLNPGNPEGRKVSEEVKWPYSIYCVLVLSTGLAEYMCICFTWGFFIFSSQPYTIISYRTAKNGI